MDLIKIRDKLIEQIKKYRYALIVLLLGIVLMTLPEFGQKNDEPQETTVQKDTEDPTQQLSEILSQIRGAGKVRLFLTLETGERTIYQTDQDGQGLDRETVLITDADRTQKGLIQQIASPVYRGAVIVCQGADDPEVRLSIVEAVSDATGLTTDRISVLKMK